MTNKHQISIRGVAINVSRFLVFLLALFVAYHMQLGHWAMLGVVVGSVAVHEFGHWFVGRSCGIEIAEFSIGFFRRPRWYLGELWGTKFYITPWLFGGFVSGDPRSESFRQHAAWKRAAFLFAGVTMNALVGVAAIWSAYLIVGAPDGFVSIVATHEGSPAAAAGIRSGDKIVSIDNRTVHKSEELVARLVLSHSDGSPATITLTHDDGQPVTLQVPTQGGRIGIEVFEHNKFRHPGFVESIKLTISDMHDLVARTCIGLGMNLGLVDKPSNMDVSVHGLIGITQAGNLIFRQGWFAFAHLIAAVEVSLFLLNLLPFGIFDGGHLSNLVYEVVSGHQVSNGIYSGMERISIAFAVVLMSYAAYNDIVHWIG